MPSRVDIWVRSSSICLSTVVGAPSLRSGHAGGLEVRHHLGRLVVPEGVDGGVDCLLGARHDHGGHDQLRSVLLSLRLVRGGRPAGPAADHAVARRRPAQVIDRDRAGREAGTVGGQQCAPQGGELARRVGLVDGLDDDQGVPRQGPTGGPDLRHGDRGVLGQEQHQTLVLDLAIPGRADPGRGVAVPEEPPQLGHELRVPRIAPVDLDHEGFAFGAGAQHGPGAGWLQLGRHGGQPRALRARATRWRRR